MNSPFENLSSHFKKNIYETFKGKLRLSILERDFNALELNKAPLNIADIGGGQGQFSTILSAQNHKITLIEPAKEMLSLACDNFKQKNLSANFINARIQNIPELNLPKQDIVMLHAVIEWLDNPYQFLEYIKPILHKNSVISLLFYNLNGLLYHNLIRGNYYYIDKENYSGEIGGLTPKNPINPAELEKILIENDMQIILKSGIRTFYDYMNPATRKKISEEDHLKMEMKFSQNPEFINSSRYLHWMIKLT